MQRPILWEPLFDMSRNGFGSTEPKKFSARAKGHNPSAARNFTSFDAKTVSIMPGFSNFGHSGGGLIREGGLFEGGGKLTHKTE